MTEAAESGERAPLAALEDAMSLNVLMRVLDTLYSAGLIASPGTPAGQGATSGVVGVSPNTYLERAGGLNGEARRCLLGMHADTLGPR